MNSQKKSGTKTSAKKKSSANKKPGVKIENEIVEFDPTAPLMPELDELVKKNPNRLIGCGG